MCGLSFVTIYATSCSSCYCKGLGLHKFSLRLVRGDWYNWSLSSYLICVLFNYCCPKYRLLLRFFTIVTISCLKMLYFEPFSVFNHDFILLTCILRQSVRLVGLVVLFSSWGRIFAVGGECNWSLVVSWSWNLDFFCMDFCFIRLFTVVTIGCVGRTVIYLSIIYF